MKRLALAGALAAFAGSAAAEPLETFNNRLFVTATANGHTTRALLDSGAEMTVLDDDFARQLGLTAEGSATARGTGAATMEARFAQDVAIGALGSEQKHNVAIIDLGEVSTRLVGRPVDMILGRELFDRAKLRIDIARGTIDMAETVPAAGIRLPIGEHRGNPTIPVSVEGGEPVQAVFDLGNGSDVLIGKAYAERLGLTAPERVIERRIGGGIGGGAERDIVAIDSLTLAGREFRNVRAAIVDNERAPDLNVGTSILRHFLITTDFPDGAVWLEPRS